MNPEMPLLRIIRRVEPLAPDDTLEHAAGRIAAAGSGLPVADEERRLVGFLDESDLLAAVTPPYLRDLHGSEMYIGDPSALMRAVTRSRARLVRDCMQAKPHCIDTDDSEMNATAHFLQTGQHTLAAVDATTRRTVGVLRLPDLLADLLRNEGSAEAG